MINFSQVFGELTNAGAIAVGGFDLVHLKDSSVWASHLERFKSWIASGRMGEMSYLQKRSEERLDPFKWYGDAQSVICCAFPYPATVGAPDEPKFASYLTNSDYHLTLKKVVTEVLEKLNINRSMYRIAVDTSPILERSLAALSGLGWIGKNTLLIHPKYGSYFFLLEIFFQEEFGRSPELLPNYCGHCNRCIEGCPTTAIDEFGLDARKCVSYHTLENRGEWIVATEELKHLGSWVAGCDICQQVCPFNMKRMRLEHFQKPDFHLNWDELMDLNPDQFRKFSKGTALSRVKPDMWDRNRAIAFLNWLHTDGKEGRKYLPKVERALENASGLSKRYWKEAYLLLQEDEKRIP